MINNNFVFYEWYQKWFVTFKCPQDDFPKSLDNDDKQFELLFKASIVLEMIKISINITIILLNLLVSQSPKLDLKLNFYSINQFLNRFAETLYSITIFSFISFYLLYHIIKNKLLYKTFK